MPRLALAVDVANFSAEFLTTMATNLLLGAKHAVVMTLYSRAHRIVLNGTSCLLRGLRKGLSLNLFLVVIVAVLA